MGGGLQERFGGMGERVGAIRQKAWERIHPERRETLETAKVVFVFDGHGAQFEGMGRDLFEKYEDIRGLCTKANQAVGYDLTEIMFTNPNDALLQTRYAQPAIVLYNEMCRRVFLKEHPDLADSKPVITGQSLGFLNACYTAGVFRSKDGSDDGFTTLMQLADARGQIFQQVCDEEETGLLLLRAGRGVDAQSFEGHIKKLTTQDKNGEPIFGIYPAIITSDTQCVVGGRKDNLQAVQEVIDSLAGKQMQSIPLQASSGAFHTPLLGDAVEPLSEYLDSISLHDAVVPLITNSQQEPRHIQRAEEIKEELLRLTTEPVYWKAVIDKLVQDGVETIYEFGDKGVGVRSLRDSRFPDIKTVGAGIAAVAGVAAVGAIAYALYRQKINK